MGSSLASQGRQQEMLSFSSFLAYFPFLSLPLVTMVSLQRKKPIPPASSCVARQTPTHHLHPPSHLPERLCWLTARPAATFSAVTISATTSFSHLLHSPILLPHFWYTDGWISQVSWYAMQKHNFFFSYGCLISCKPKGRDKRDDSHCHDADITPMTFLCIN